MARTAGRRDAYEVLVGGPAGKRSRRNHRRKREDNTQVDLQDIGSGAWSGLIWLRIGTSGGHL